MSELFLQFSDQTFLLNGTLLSFTIEVEILRKRQL